MRPVIYYRGVEFEKEELNTASQQFFCTNRLPQIEKDDLVIGRYSMWPFYADQEKDVNYLGAKLINDYHQHLYIADLGNYVGDLGNLTPRTWRHVEDIPDNGAFVVKGETNSKKGDWKNSMYAPNKAAAIDICNRLSNDSLLGQQKLYVREYIPLIKLMDGVNGMPVTEECRFFVAYGVVLCGGYYWHNYIDDITFQVNHNKVPDEFLQKVIRKVGDKSNFYVIDVAKTKSGEWIVIELNDGQQAGLSAIPASDLYRNLVSVLNLD
jgi:hypothetical protein